MNRPLTAEYIVELFEGVKDCQSETDWEHNKKRFVELIKEYRTEQCNIANVVGQSEQLKAFADWLQSDTANLNYDFKDLVDEYLKSL